MATSFATYAQLTAWLADGDVDTPAEDPGTRLLARATTLIERATGTAVYNLDDADLPEDDDIAQALADATCAQVEWWLVTDDEHGQTEGFTEIIQSGTHLTGRFARLAPRAADLIAVGKLNPGSQQAVVW